MAPCRVPPADTSRNRWPHIIGAVTGNEHTQPRRLQAIFTKKRMFRLTWPLAAVLVVGGLLGVGFAAVIDMPRIDSLAEFSPAQITEIYDHGGQRFASFARERRVLIEEGEVPELLRQAVLAAEDRNFLQHGGVDAEGVLRAVIRNLLSQRQHAFGGSTITMQLARKLFLSPKKVWRRKIEEALLAVELEKSYSKQQILTLYCNLMFLGHGNYGMEAAARSYFGKPTTELAPHEIATLVGILQRPSDYSPYRRPDLVVKRRDYVLRRMFEERFLDRDGYDAAVAEPLTVLPRGREAATAPYFAEEVRQRLEEQYGTATLLEGGLQVTTTLDQRIQVAAEEALEHGLVSLDRRIRGWGGPIQQLEFEDATDVDLESWRWLDLSPGKWNQGVVVALEGDLARVKLGTEVLELDRQGIRWTRKRRPRDLLSVGDVVWVSVRQPEGETDPRRLDLQQRPDLQGAVVVVESSTGAVRALIGGWDFATSKFNRALQAQRQVGSAFKPFVYGAAIEAGYTVADTIFDAPTAFPGASNELTYSPRNYYREYYGVTTLRRALELSLNVAAVKTMDMVGVDSVIDFARRVGVEAELPPYPSLALGSAEITPIQLAAAYGAIANQGLYVEPYLIETVVDPSGKVLAAHQMKARKAMEPEVAYVLTHTLEGVVDQGTAKDMRNLPLDLAGKTGTTDDYSDAWFAGFTPRYTMLVWVGRDIKKRIGRNMSGTVAALPIWKRLAEAGLENGWLHEGEQFTVPPGVTFRQIEYATGLLAESGAGRTIDEAFIEGTEPVLPFDPKWNRILSLPWYQQRTHYEPKVSERMPEDLEDWTQVLESWQN